jgi:hypothetical protein
VRQGHAAEHSKTVAASESTQSQGLLAAAAAAATKSGEGLTVCCEARHPGFTTREQCVAGFGVKPRRCSRPTPVTLIELLPAVVDTRIWLASFLASSA